MPLKSQADAAAAEEEEEEKEEEEEEEEGAVLISISQIHPRCSSCHSTKFWLMCGRTKAPIFTPKLEKLCNQNWRLWGQISP